MCRLRRFISHPLNRGHRYRVLPAAMVIVLLACHPLAAVIIPSAGYIYDTLAIGDTAQSCVAAAPRGTFVGVGPGFSANANSIVQVSESGVVRTVMTGFNSISDCAYDRASDTLYVGDNADSGELPAALTGDTVFAIPAASSATGLSAVGHELLPQNSVPSAAGIAIDAAGNVFAGDAVGPGAGSVQKLTPSQSTFVAGLDYTGGLAFDPSDGSLLVLESLSSFESQISRYSAAGAFLSTVAGPSFAFGSYDLALTHDGLLLATGSSNVAALTAAGGQSTFASGFSFPTGISTDPLSGRVTILESFSFSAADASLHHFTPVAKLVPGGKTRKTECVHEYYGVELVAKKPGATPRDAICVDGAECDADGEVNDTCVFPVGFCFRAADPRFTECTQTDISEISFKAKPTSAVLDTLFGEMQTALPLTAATCFFSDGYAVPVKITSRGKRAGKGSIKVKAKAAQGRDSDTLRMVCQPAP